ncbi:MAG: putative LPS assembly protein LptD [Gemmatimonadaceae bacterium]
MRGAGAARLIAFALGVLPGIVGAQVKPQPPPRPQPQVPTAAPRQPQRPGGVPTQRSNALAFGDTVRKDTLLWSPPDSIMAGLLTKPGYTVTRYEGDVVTFDAVTKALAIAADSAKRAIVERDGMRVVTDSVIVYDDRTKKVNVAGRFEVVLGSDQAPVTGQGTATYDMRERSGRLTNATVTVDETGDRWFIRSEIGKTALGDSTRGIPPRFYGLGGSLTSCEDSIPDYHFKLREIKRTEKTLVARPAVLYLQDIPVMWLPFVFQDIRPGRRSGILPPRFGASDIVRNNPGYRRHIENIGYYWAFSDYADFTAWANWRSSAGADSLDPGWYQLNGEWKYSWLTRFLTGGLAAGYMQERDGKSNLSVSWNHRQRLGTNRNFSSNVNYTTSTRLQRRNTFNPVQAIATIASTFNFSDKLGPASLQVGGTQRQYPGRDQIDRTLPTVTVSTSPLSLGDWMVWTPSFSYTESVSLNNDQPGTFSNKYVGGPNGELIRVDTLKKNEFNRTVSLGSPLRLFGVDFSQNVTIRDRLLDFPEEKVVYPGADSARRELRVFGQTYRTDVDWNPSFSLPPIFQNRFKLTPSVTLQNVASGPFWVRTELNGGKFVHQSKRLAYGLSAAPTIFGIWPGFGPFQRFRHSVSPGISYSYAPRADVPDEYLEALGQFRGAFTSLPQSAVSLSLSQNIEAKVRAPQDTAPGVDGQKLKVLSMSFTPFSYDFERARKTGRKLAGVTTENFGTSLTSDLLPGFDLSVNYSLFQGSTSSDTAVFKPFLTTVSSHVRLSQKENPFTVITRLFGRAVPDRSPAPAIGVDASPEEAALTRQTASQPVAGQAARGSQFVVPPSQGWEASFNFSSSKSRPIVGDRVIPFDPRIRCEPLRAISPFAYQECLERPSHDEPIEPTTAGAAVVQMPRQTSLSGNLRFELTRKWAASWNTSYDFELSQFASHIVSLQRDLHDWRAIFAFTHSPNGNFAFNFFIALKPQPDLKFDYSRATVRSR